MQNSFKLKNECNLILFWNQVCVQKHVFEHENHFLSLQFMRSKEKHHQTKNIEVKNMEILQEIVHPDYYTSKINTLVNDIMLFKLAKPAAALNIYVQPICLDLDNSLDMLGEPGHDDITTATVD